MIFYQVLSTNSIRQCMGTSVENLYWILGLKRLMLLLEDDLLGALPIGQGSFKSGCL